MITSRVPPRLTLGGGGTDKDPYPLLLKGGFALCAAIDRFVYVTANRSSFDDHIRLKMRKSEDVESVGALQDEVTRAALEHVGINRDIEILHYGDIPDGTGLGTSSARLVGLMQVLNYYNGVRLNPKELAEAAAYIEIEKLGRPIGKQDPYMAAYGGFRALWFDPDGSVRVEDPCIPQETINALSNNLLLFYTGQRRQSGIILGEQKRLAESGDKLVIGYHSRAKDLGFRILEALKSVDLVGFGELMHEQWMEKCKLPGGVSNSEFDRMYEIAKDNGAIGGKLGGAGGGGCFTLFADPLKRKKLIEAMAREGLRRITYEFDYRGAVLSTELVERQEAISASQSRSSER